MYIASYYYELLIEPTISILYGHCCHNDVHMYNNTLLRLKGKLDYKLNLISLCALGQYHDIAREWYNYKYVIVIIVIIITHS